MGVDMSESHEAMDVREHETTYSLFIKGTIGLTVAVVVLMTLMALFLV